jgi:hypothetical protein
VTVPTSVIEHRTAAQVMAERPQQVLQDAQRQPLASLAIGLAAASDSAQAGHLRARRVAVEDLQNKQMNGRHGIEDAITPDMTNSVADGANKFGAEKLGDFRLDLLHGSEDTAGHPWPPVGVR